LKVENLPLTTIGTHIMNVEHRNGGSSTAIMEEPIELQPAVLKQDRSIVSPKLMTTDGGRSLNDGENTQDRNESLPSPTTASAEQPETWNNPRVNLYRFPAILWAFAVVRMCRRS
jgi:hypothetical protein